MINVHSILPRYVVDQSSDSCGHDERVARKDDMGSTARVSPDPANLVTKAEVGKHVKMNSFPSTLDTSHPIPTNTRYFSFT